MSTGQGQYQRPDVISSDMGGSDVHLDERLSMVIKLLESAPLDNVKKVLDVGIGKGQLAKWFVDKGKLVTGTGLEIASYGLDQDSFLQKHGIKVLDCPVENMPFADGEFDAVVMSHILEHVPNVQLALQEVRRVLANDGYLFIFVPPEEDFVAAGHISIGWNIGQLIYVLLLNGFDVKNGQFIEYGYNVCGFVQKSAFNLPALRGDRGDIYILAQAGLLPLPIKKEGNAADSFYAKIKAVNWPNASQLLKQIPRSKKYKLIYNMVRIVPKSFKKKLAGIFGALSKILLEQGGYDGDVNPPFFRG